MKKTLLISSLVFMSSTAMADTNQSDTVEDNVIAAQRFALAKNTQGKGFGPQSPRDIDNLSGNNHRAFGAAPDASQMNLCNIHLHKYAEHKGGEFTKYVGNGNGKGMNTGYAYSGTLTPSEKTPFDFPHHQLQSGDTIEVHYVYSTADVKPGHTLGACLSKNIHNPQLRVESQVYVLVNDKKAPDFLELTKHKMVNGYHQAVNIPNDTGTPIVYAGSTTGPRYNEQGSPFQVTWQVRPKVEKVNIATVAQWFKHNDFQENHAHGVRNLVINPDLLSSNAH